ncbi:hypothetical protein [uncultured Sunxiuqinia sp.]|uniref:hypothetical protein n=1 Tax=uncultured Sunxiuqinia sp. TaxID=1573825 RepID=UPI002AA73504|nr:hypothetical protein [uncultured Sunxiuqinia sp.]
MDFKGGAIIIGSLFWEETPKRMKWRQVYLETIEKKIPVRIRIRYGRKSSTRQDTFTMIVSNHPNTEFGIAYILPFKENIKNARNLESQAFAMAGAEGFWKKSEPSLNKNWGTVGLLINPKLEKSRSLETIRERWTKLYSEYDWDKLDYQIENEPELIDKNGFLNIEWTEEMNDFDFLIATLTVPDPKKFLDAQTIADKINETGYNTYFLTNYQNGIRTFQDERIIEKLKK